MTNLVGVSWAESNQRHLAAELARLRGLLEAHLGQKTDTPDMPDPAEIAAQMPESPALDTVCNIFGLSPFERNILLLCAGMELDARLPGLCAAINDPTHPHPTFSMALGLLPGAHWSALTPAAPLRYWRLVELENNTSLTRAKLRIDERILHYLAGTPHLDERLAAYTSPIARTEALVPSHQQLAEAIARVWAQTSEGALPVIQLAGGDLAVMRQIAAEASAQLGLGLYSLPASSLPSGAVELDGLRRLWERESALGNSALLMEALDIPTHPALESALQDWVARLNSPLIVAGSEPLRNASRPVIRFEVTLPTPVEQHSVWKSALGAQAERLNGRMESIISHFNLEAGAIRRISAKALQVEQADPDEIASALWAACMSETHPRLGELAQRITPMAGWNDLVLPDEQHSILREIAIHVRQRMKVYETWGFAAKSARGLGISALFSGPSGTGKTMAAEVLANELHLDLYRIDLSQVVSKYIGETEKNLSRVFDAADVGGAILLFDEADALFGKRSEVKDSHDRYANVEVSYLLQRMEVYRGLAILTTNLKDALDQAFLRRIRFVVHFPFPDLNQRAEIWRHIFPAQTPIEALDFERLARLNVAGGNIRNIAMQAAFLAAEVDEPVRMNHLLRAARTEYAKLERPLSESELGGRA